MRDESGDAKMVGSWLSFWHLFLQECEAPTNKNEYTMNEYEFDSRNKKERNMCMQVKWLEKEQWRIWKIKGKHQMEW
jgi:hypothetical protein